MRRIRRSTLLSVMGFSFFMHCFG